MVVEEEDTEGADAAGEAVRHLGELRSKKRGRTAGVQD